MSKAQSIQNKIWKAYGKVGKTLGKPFSIYRAPTTNYPIIPENWIDTKNVAFSQDTKFARPLDDGTPLWMCWIDGRLNNLFDVQAGDYISDDLTGETYVIVSAQPHTFIRALSTPNKISVYGNETYTDGVDGLAQTKPLVSMELPCNIRQPSSSTSNGYVPVQTLGFESVPQYEIHVWDPNNEIKIGYQIVDEHGNESLVVSVFKGEAGTRLQ